MQQLVAGENFSCALAYIGGGTHVWCWGDNSYGQLGRPASECGFSPIGVKVDLPASIAENAALTILFAGPTARGA